MTTKHTIADIPAIRHSRVYTSMGSDQMLGFEMWLAFGQELAMPRWHGDQEFTKNVVLYRKIQGFIRQYY